MTSKKSLSHPNMELSQIILRVLFAVILLRKAHIFQVD